MSKKFGSMWNLYDFLNFWSLSSTHKGFIAPVGLSTCEGICFLSRVFCTESRLLASLAWAGLEVQRQGEEISGEGAEGRRTGRHGINSMCAVAKELQKLLTCSSCPCRTGI